MLNITARRKYDQTVTQPGQVLVREVLRAKDMTEDKFLQRLELLEFKASQWRDRKTGQPAPRKSWVYYMTANQLDEVDALFAFRKDLDERVTALAMASMKGNDPHKGSNHNKVFSSPESMYKTCLEKSPQRTYVKLDVDTKDPNHLVQIDETLKEAGVTVTYTIQTRGGYHVLFPCGKNLKKLKDLETKVLREHGKQAAWFTFETPSTSPRLAVPGTFQSEHVPTMVEWGPELWNDTAVHQSAFYEMK
jgi:hypothetical protein